jgi:transcriptional regulator with XRE-family HTH domain
MPLDAAEVGRRIREARLALGWTHEELARRMGVNWRSVHRWQKGQLPRLETLVRLAETLDVPQSYLVESADPGATLGDLRAHLDALSERVDALARAVHELANARGGEQSAGGPRRGGPTR